MVYLSFQSAMITSMISVFSLTRIESWILREPHQFPRIMTRSGSAMVVVQALVDMVAIMDIIGVSDSSNWTQMKPESQHGRGWNMENSRNVWMSKWWWTLERWLYPGFLKMIQERRQLVEFERI